MRTKGRFPQPPPLTRKGVVSEKRKVGEGGVVGSGRAGGSCYEVGTARILSKGVRQNGKDKLRRRREYQRFAGGYKNW